MKKILLILSLVIFAGTSCQQQSTVIEPQTGNGGDAPLNPNQQKLLDLVNKSRTEGCNCGNVFFQPVGLVVWNITLENAAKKHSEYMNRTGNFSHTGENGSDAGDRIDAEGYTWSTYGENIAEGYSTEEDVMQGWLNSEGHCKNIMDPDFKEMGVATSGRYWTQVFASK